MGTNTRKPMIKKNQPQSYYEEIMRSAPHDQKIEAYKIMNKKINSSYYQICPACGRVGQIKFRRTPYMRRMIAAGIDLFEEKMKRKDRRKRYYNPIPYFYHYSREEGKKYCSLKHHEALKELEKSAVRCPKCRKKGTYSTKMEVHGTYSLGWCIGSLDTQRVVIRHGRYICYITQEHLEQLRKKYTFVKQKKTARAVKIKDGDDEDIPKYYGKIRLGSKLKEFEKMEFRIKILEGHKRAKEAGKQIKYDVDRKLQDCKKRLFFAKKKTIPAPFMTNP